MDKPEPVTLEQIEETIRIFRELRKAIEPADATTGQFMELVAKKSVNDLHQLMFDIDVDAIEGSDMTSNQKEIMKLGASLITTILAAKIQDTLSQAELVRMRLRRERRTRAQDN
jgi:hypothetical protein